jgi:carbon-monoxide dehydrogenase medium subunit
MIPVPFDYAAPTTIGEAVALLERHTSAEILAGGHNLLPAMRLRHIRPTMLIDLARIGDLRGIWRDVRTRSLHIGAMTTYAEIASHRDVRQSYAALAEAALKIGDPQVRHCGTIGGNLAYGAPDADLPAVALALDATITIVGPNRSRTMRADTFFSGAPSDVLAPTEIITSVIFPEAIGRSGSAYEKLRNPASFAPICGVAAFAGSDPDIIRVAVTGATARATRIQVALPDAALDPDDIAAATERAITRLDFISDHFASAEYRAHLTALLTGRALSRAIQRAMAFEDYR